MISQSQPNSKMSQKIPMMRCKWSSMNPTNSKRSLLALWSLTFSSSSSIKSQRRTKKIKNMSLKVYNRSIRLSQDSLKNLFMKLNQESPRQALKKKISKILLQQMNQKPFVMMTMSKLKRKSEIYMLKLLMPKIKKVPQGPC